MIYFLVYQIIFYIPVYPLFIHNLFLIPQRYILTVKIFNYQLN